MEEPKLIKGGFHTDARGCIQFNNDFNALAVKRIYVIENSSTEVVRAWQGHAIERRWFSAISGSFVIKLIKVTDWKNPDKKSTCQAFQLDAPSLDMLEVPKGYVSSIQAVTEDAKLLVLADYLLGEVADEYRFDLNYFDCSDIEDTWY